MLVADHPLVAYLAAGLRVERSLRQNERRLGWGAHAFRCLLTNQQRQDLAAAHHRAVAGEFGAWYLSYQLRPCFLLSLASKHIELACLLLLALHGAIEPSAIHGEAALVGNFLGKFQWKPVGIIKFKRNFTR